MKPYKFQPYLKTTFWGGYQIAPFKGIFNAQPNVGESWEISGVPGHESVAVNRGLIDDVDEGLTLVELIDKYKGLLVGQKVYKKFGNKFPLLVKFIDSRQDLSVQVHPDDKLAMERHGCAGKTEMWYIIKSDVGAKIYAGLKKSITPEEYEQLATAEVVCMPSEQVISSQKYNRPATSLIVSMISVVRTNTVIRANCISSRPKMPLTIRCGPLIVHPMTAPSPFHSSSTVPTLWCIV